jgi:PAS domain S-box-containing protein
VRIKGAQIAAHRIHSPRNTGSRALQTQKLDSQVPGKKHPNKRNDAQWLQLLIDSIVDYAIYTIDIDGQVASWNSGAARLKGYSAEEIIGQPFAKFFTPEDRARELPQEALDTAARIGRFETEGWRVRADGTRFWALAVIDAVREHDGELVGFAHVTRDMTDRRLEQTRLLEPSVGSANWCKRSLTMRSFSWTRMAS